MGLAAQLFMEKIVFGYRAILCNVRPSMFLGSMHKFKLVIMSKVVNICRSMYKKSDLATMINSLIAIFLLYFRDTCIIIASSRRKNTPM
jgi:hypothetical protein